MVRDARCPGRFSSLPVLENEDVLLAGGTRHRLQTAFLRDHAVVEFRLHRNRRGHIAVEKVLDEVFGFAVFPIGGMNVERAGTEWTPIVLAENLKLHPGQGV